MTATAEHPALHAVPDPLDRPVSFARTDLASLIEHPPPAPRIFRGLIYSGKMHTLSGPPGCGKTILSLWVGLQAMQAGARVLYLDEENGARHIAGLLLSMGAEPDMIGSLFSYHSFLDLRWDADDCYRLHSTIEEFNPRLCIFDSGADMLSAAGVNENDASEVTRFWKRVLVPVSRELGSAVLLLDHDGKYGGSSRYARGSVAKLAKPDVAYKVETLNDFSCYRSGAMRLKVSKDRLGLLRPSWRIEVSPGPLTLSFTGSDVTGFDDH